MRLNIYSIAFLSSYCLLKSPFGSCRYCFCCCRDGSNLSLLFLKSNDTKISQNSLFNSALRQSTSIRKDLDTFSSTSTASSALLGQLNASLTSFSRTIDDYNNLAKQEIVESKKEKALERVKGFRAELEEYRETLGRLKREQDEKVSSSNPT